jgi:hypothetical protein
MRILATTAYPDAEPLGTLRRLASAGVRHSLTENVADADAILFVEHSHYTDDPFFAKLKHHPWVRRYRDQVFMYNEHDRPWCSLPGIYCAMPLRSFDPRRQVAVRYLRLLNPLVADPGASEPDVLFSFVGSSHVPLRRRIVALRDPRAVIEDTSKFNAFYPTGITPEHRHYADVLVRSKFILCPRGAGTNTIRLFETLKAGRVPVIISDQWVAPQGPNWASFSLRISEKCVDSIPAIIYDHETRWPDMSSAARQAWADWFSDEVLFDRIGDALEMLVTRRQIPEYLAQRLPSLGSLDWRLRVTGSRLKCAIRDHFGH